MSRSRFDRLSRRDFFAASSAAALGLGLWPRQALAASGGTSLSASEGIKRLMAGNARFVNGVMECNNVSSAKRVELTAGQAPFAAILSCADSRVPPNLLFDQGLGELFVVRVAGNIVTPAELGSLEYAVDHLHAPLIFVLGHDKCGAVAATIDAVKTNGHAEGAIQTIVEAITPAVQVAQTQSGDLLDNAIRENVKLMVSSLGAAKPILEPAFASGKLQVAGGVYRLATGVVDLIR